MNLIAASWFVNSTVLFAVLRGSMTNQSPRFGCNKSYPSKRSASSFLAAGLGVPLFLLFRHASISALSSVLRSRVRCPSAPMVWQNHLQKRLRPSGPGDLFLDQPRGPLEL